MNKIQQQTDIFYGEHAETLLTNPAFQQSLVRIRARLLEQFGRSGLFQKRKREVLWHRVQLLDDFEQELELMIRDANLAKSDIEQQKRSKVAKL